MKQFPLLEVNNLTVQLAGKVVLNNVSFEIVKGECLAIVGLSGSGKSILLQSLASKYANKGNVNFNIEGNKNPNVVVVSQQHQFKNLSNTSSFYYQQRFNSNDAEDALSINDIVENLSADQEKIDAILHLFGIDHIRYTRLIQLSNGEHKRFQLARAVLQNADWILLDSPYTGLDIKARKSLNAIIEKLIFNGLNILLVTSYANIPDFITHVALLEKGNLKFKLSRKEFEKINYTSAIGNALPAINLESLLTVIPMYSYDEFSVAVKMINTSVIYNDRKILDKVNWEVNKGECWHVSGHNGSGKSTLLSLITGDNPQAFANDIYLFDRKKGSGESIWDIKQKIGYVSPELHHYFEQGCSCFEVVASGLFDTIGLFKKLSEKQKLVVTEWISLLGIDAFSNITFRQLSNGQQRLVLLARALVKNPPLLILDEPCQGLDNEVSAWFISLINDICVKMKKTLIYVSHYDDEIPACVTYNLKLEQGKIAA